MIKKDNSVNPLKNLGINDMEVCQAFGLSPELAYTKDLNQSCADLMFQKNVVNFQKYEGMDEGEARREAGRLRAEAMRIYK